VGYSQWLMMRASDANASSARFAPVLGCPNNGGTFDATEGTQSFPWPAAGKFKSATVYLGTDPGGTASRRFQLSVNGTPSTVIDVTVNHGSTTATVTGDVTIAAGDIVSWKHTPTNTPAASTITIWLEWLPTTDDEYGYGGPFGSGVALSAAGQFNPLLHGANLSTLTSETLAKSQSIAPIAGQITGFFVKLGTQPGVGTSWDFSLRINGADVGSLLNISGTSTTGNQTGLSQSVSVGDKLTFHVVNKNGAAASTLVSWGVIFKPSTSGQFCLTAGDETADTAATFFMTGGAAGANHIPENSTEASVQVTVPATMSLISIAYALTTTPGAGKTWALDSRIGGVNGTVHIAAGNATSGSDTAHSDSLSSGNLIDVALTTTGAGGGPTAMGSHSWGVGFTTAPQSVTLAPAAATLSLAGGTNTVAVSDNKTMAPAAATLSLSGGANTVLTPVAVAPAAAAQTLAGASASVVISDLLVPSAAGLTLTPATPTAAATQNRLLGPAPAALTLTPAAGAVEVPLTPAPASLVLAGGTNDVEIAEGPTPTFDETVRFGYIVDRPQVMYDGSAIVNRVIPFGVDSDGSDLTLEHAQPASLPYAIQTDGDVWYIEDTASQAIYGLQEQRVYRTDIKNPYRTNATGTLTIAVQPTAGDTFTVGSTTYTFVSSLTGAAGEILLGADVNATRQNVVAALKGSDVYNTPALVNPVSITDDKTGLIVATTYQVFDSSGQPLDPAYYDPATGLYNQTAATKALNAAQKVANYGTSGNLIATTSSFTSGSNGFQDPTLLGGYDAVQTANTLYATAVDMLLRQRSEIFSMRCRVANGRDIWSLPGDRVHVRFRGLADTMEALTQNGSSRVVWIDVDEWMLITERTDSSDESGVRQVEFVLAAPTMSYSIPALPEWTDPIALPVPGNTESTPPGSTGGGIGDPGGGIDVGGVDPPGAPWLTDTLGNLVTRNKLPTDQCCPDPTTDITSGGALPPGDTLEWIATSATTYVLGVDTLPQPDASTVIIIAAGGRGGGGPPSLRTNSNCDSFELLNFDVADGSSLVLEWTDHWRFWVVSARGDGAEYSLSLPGEGTIIIGRAVASQPIPNGISIDPNSAAVTADQAADPTWDQSLATSTTVPSEDTKDAIFGFFAYAADLGDDDTWDYTFNGTNHPIPLVTTWMPSHIGVTTMPSTASLRYQGGGGAPFGDVHHFYLVSKSIRLRLNEA
jgi:hypothetical protein